MHHFSLDLPRPPSATPRHALLFELIRQRGLAQSVSLRIARAAPPQPVDLSHLAMIAARSLGAPDQPSARM